MSKVYEGFFDGSAIPNPGTMRIGCYIKDPDGKVIFEYKQTLGFGTNNEAEYLALLVLSEHLLKLTSTHGLRHVRIFGDSQLVVNQINGKYKINKDQLRFYCSTILGRLKTIEDWSIAHVYREKNKQADTLTRK
jgi:ribonuclease HI